MKLRALNGRMKNLYDLLHQGHFRPRLAGSRPDASRWRQWRRPRRRCAGRRAHCPVSTRWKRSNRCPLFPVAGYLQGTANVINSTGQYGFLV